MEGTGTGLSASDVAKFREDLIIRTQWLIREKSLPQ